jgi:hypothetical protein
MAILSAGFFSLIINYPFETARIRMTMEYRRKKDYSHYSGIYDCLRKAKK